MSSHLVLCEVEGDKHNLDDGEDGDPQQEDMDKGVLCSLWHCLSERQSSKTLKKPGESEKTELMTVHVLGLLCCAPKQSVRVFVCLLPELSVCL